MKRPSATIIEFENVSKLYGKVLAVDDVSLKVDEGEFFALLGPSGCGKTTLLRMLAGFEVPSSGRILIDGQDVSSVPPNKRPVNMVFQSYAVFPHMTVTDNVGYGLRVEGVAAAERSRRVDEALALVKLDGYGARKPDQLSGGQRQRVALARALIKRPRVLLLDEPLSALDAQLREAMRSELAQLQETVGITFLFVTHDQDEALAMASRCAVMDKGVLQQVATPNDLYERPASRFVAGFIGSVNLFEGRVSTFMEDGAIVQTTELAAPLQVATAAAAVGETVWVALRPENILMSHGSDGDWRPASDDAAAGCNMAKGVIRQMSYLGSESVFEVEVESGRRLRVLRSNLARRDKGGFILGESVWLSWRAAAASVLSS